jgi:hypothetical protein
VKKQGDIFLDYSKIEILALLLLYRKKHANMTEIAEYILVKSSPYLGLDLIFCPLIIRPKYGRHIICLKLEYRVL